MSIETLLERFGNRLLQPRRLAVPGYPRPGRRRRRSRLSGILHSSLESCESLEHRLLLAADLGDAPDTQSGTAMGDYRTVASDNGALHSLPDTGDPTVFLGSSVDADDGTQQNPAASADRDDGVINPLQLRATIRSQPTITLLASNQNSVSATLAGWIDMNRDGSFDDATERAVVNVPAQTEGGHFTLVFPILDGQDTGTTYARFRLSTDSSAMSATGPADDGEVEDYLFEIVSPTTGFATGSTKYGHQLNGGPQLSDGDQFGTSLASIGDLDGNGVNDLVAGAYQDDGGGNDRGAIHVLLMDENQEIGSSVRITHQTNGGPDLQDLGFFGSSISCLGDLDRDGVADLAVGAWRDGTDGNGYGSVFILFMNTDGTVRSWQRIGHDAQVGLNLSENDFFGSALATLGDLDDDGVVDLAVGAFGDDTGGSDKGAVHLLFLNTDGTVKDSIKIAEQLNNGPSLGELDRFGSALAAIGDIDGNGFIELAVGAPLDNTGGTDRGSVHLLFFEGGGVVQSSLQIAHGVNSDLEIENLNRFGSSVASAGDLDGDGVNEMVVGAINDNSGGAFRGSVRLIYFNADGTVRRSVKIADGINGGPDLQDDDYFGSAIASPGDLNGDGLPEISVSARGESTAGEERGAIWNLSLAPLQLNVTIGDSTMSEFGGSATATVSHNNPDTSRPVEVLLSSADPTEASVPALVTIPAGSASVSFTISAVDDPLEDGTQTATILVAAPGYTGHQDTIDVTDAETELVIELPGSSINDMTPQLNWNAVPGAARYEIYVRDLEKTERIVDEEDLTDTFYVPNDPWHGRQYRIWVRPISAFDEYGPWSDDIRFWIKNAPQLTAPTTYRLIDDTPTLEWSDVPDETWGQPEIMEFWLTRNRKKHAHVLDITTNPYTTDSLPMGEYFIWTRGILPGGIFTGWSRAISRVIVTPPTLTGPTGAIDAVRPTITWNNLPGAATYELYISDVTGGVSPLLQPSGITETSWQVTEDLVEGHSYKVWIRAYDERGWRGYYGAAMDFQVVESSKGKSADDSIFEPGEEEFMMPGIEAARIVGPVVIQTSPPKTHDPRWVSEEDPHPGLDKKLLASHRDRHSTGTPSADRTQAAAADSMENPAILNHSESVDHRSIIDQVLSEWIHPTAILLASEF